MKKGSVSIVLLFITLLTQAQFSRYIIQFTDKGPHQYSLNQPIQFLSQRAIDRRTRYAIVIDSSDLPVNKTYLDSIRSSGTVTILNASRWLNSVSIQTNDSVALARIKQFPFVRNVGPIATRFTTSQRIDKFNIPFDYTTNSTSRTEGTNDYNYGQSFAQVHIHNGEFLHHLGLGGQNMIIGMLDAGFLNYTSLSAFDSINKNGQVLGIYDFVAHDSSVAEDYVHGMECLSTIAANIPGQFVGTAPEASFFLFRTEDISSEYPIEEHNWVCGAERVDSAGGDVISSSLGYNQFDNAMFNHTYADMNGHTTMAATGAMMAAKKGILVVSSAGNEGNTAWHYIMTPADADSILTVGAVARDSTVASFSSYGPSADGRIKPDVASVGVNTIVESPNNSIASNNGTSFACPNLAGLAACLWQGFPELNNQQIIDALRKAGSTANAPNDRIGYGIPDMKKAMLTLLKDFTTTSASVSDCIVMINWKSKDISAMQYEIERKLPGQNAYTKMGTQSGTGTVFITQNYQFIDSLKDVQAGTLSYRIKQIIDTAQSTYTAAYIDSFSVVVNASCITTAINPVTGTDNSFTIIPNPAHDEVVIKFTSAKLLNNAQINIYNNIGQVVYRLPKILFPGINLIPVNIRKQGRGKYFISIYASGKLIGTKELIRL